MPQEVDGIVQAEVEVDGTSQTNERQEESGTATENAGTNAQNSQGSSANPE